MLQHAKDRLSRRPEAPSAQPPPEGVIIDLEGSSFPTSPSGGERATAVGEKGKTPLPETSTAGQGAAAATSAIPAAVGGVAGEVTTLGAVSAPTAQVAITAAEVAGTSPGQAGRPPLPAPIAEAIEGLCARISAQQEGANAREAALLARVEEVERKVREVAEREAAATSCFKLAQECVKVLEQDLDAALKAFAAARNGEKATANALAKHRAMDATARSLLQKEFAR